MTTTLKPRDKLDAVMANGPEDEPVDWDRIDWGQTEVDVRRLRQRIFTATQAGDLKRVRNLQKLMLRSRANALLSVRRVAEVNAGRKTAGIDGRTALMASQKADLADWVQHPSSSWTPRPVKRVYVPKPDGRRRPLGIPVIRDRAYQAVVANALEPEWEARFESRSYGFRPGRGCQDAIQAVYITARGASCRRVWALDADLKAAFDRIDHAHLLASLATFPARGLVERWLKAGVVEHGWFTPTDEGTPQGGVISPCLMNVALHGMEQAAGVRYIATGSNAGTARPGSPVVIRYADDLLALCHSRDQAEQVKARLAEWLEPRGLAFNEDKTRVVHLDQGCDFLGFNIRRYHGKLLIKPSKAALVRVRKRLAAEMRALRGVNAEAVMTRLNPIIRGWSAYYRHVVSAKEFNALDDYVWKLTYKWAKHTHPHKPKRWIVSRYFGRFHPTRKDKWVFGDRETGAYLLKFSWTPIVRHVMVKGWASPDDPALAEYWATRRRRTAPAALGRHTLSLLRAQQGRCPICRGLLLYADHEPQDPQEWERWLAATRKAVRKKSLAAEQGPDKDDDKLPTLRLIHTSCLRRLGDDRPAQQPATPLGLA